MSRYLISLMPTGRFFFGGDMTFSVGTKKENKVEGSKNISSDEKERELHNEKFSSYIIQSMTFPQQTSLLGMLRFLILSNNPDAFNSETQRIKNKVKAAELIGEQGFGVTDKHDSGNFGEISSIGTCFLRHHDNNYFMAPADYDLSIDGFENKVTAKLNGKDKVIPTIKKGNELYTSKMGVSHFYIDKNGDRKEEKDIFICDSRIGIRKNETGKTEEGAFYKQIGYRMKEDTFQFAFVADIISVDVTQYNGQLVSLGADSSMFIFNAIAIKEKTESLDKPEKSEEFKKKNEIEEPNLQLPEGVYPFIRGANSWERIVLLSETYLEEKDLEKIYYAIVEIKPFRFLSFNVKDEDYNVMRTINKRSNRYNLYKAGSVFYLPKEDAASFKINIDAKREFVQIGYNKYIN